MKAALVKSITEEILIGKQWVFGITETNRGFLRTVMVPISDRTSSTLLPIIKEFISKEAAFVCSDKWRAYSNLSSLGYNHAVVNHAKNFIARSE